MFLFSSFIKIRAFLASLIILMLIQFVWVGAVYAKQKAYDGPRWYRFVDEKGVTHTVQSMPRKHVDGGYQVLNNKFKVIETIESREVIEERAAKEAKEKQDRLSKEQQKLLDDALRKKYVDSKTALYSLYRKLKAMNNKIKQNNLDIKSAELKLLEWEEKAAKALRRSKDETAISPQTQKAIENYSAKIGSLKADNLFRESEKNKVINEYRVAINRLLELDKKPSMSDDDVKAHMKVLAEQEKQAKEKAAKEAELLEAEKKRQEKLKKKR